MGDLTANFSKSEFTCRCGCGFDGIEYNHVVMLQAMRTDLGRSISVNSGCRCKKHNESVGGKDGSEHTTGEGSDHPFDNTMELSRFVKAAYAAGFERIGIDFKNKFVHLGSGFNHPTPRLWGY